MKKTLTLLVATTALTATFGLPAWSAMRTGDDAKAGPFAAAYDEAQQAFQLIFVSDDDDDDDDDDHDKRSGYDDDDDDDCDDDDSGCAGAAGPAPAGTVAPPQNGLFGNGAPPQVQVN
jgi:hypothetical protein